ncbi:hypothetical protein [Stenotrophomonas phage BUCTxx99]|nr:hypothetical protein [Stenotrophomonas phage BUCTxx99]
MFVRKSKYRAMEFVAAHMYAEANLAQLQLTRMTENWQKANDEVKALLAENQRLHEALMATQKTPSTAFTRAHLQFIRRACHPDRNPENITATEITQICNRELS